MTLRNIYCNIHAEINSDISPVCINSSRHSDRQLKDFTKQKKTRQTIASDDQNNTANCNKSKEQCQSTAGCE